MTRHLRLATLASGAAATLLALTGTGASAQEGEDAPVSGDVVVTEGLELTGSLDQEAFDVWANVLGLRPHGSEETLQVYCIDIRTDIDFDSPYAEGDWEESGVANLEQVRWVLFNGHPNVAAENLLTEAGAVRDEAWDEAATTQVAYAGTQAAVWHFTDGFALDLDEPVIDGTEEQNEAVAAVYEHLIGNAGRLPDPSEFYLDLEGAETASYQDGRFGPYTIRSSAGPVELTSEGGSLVDADGEPVESLSDGEDFHIVLDEGSERISIAGRATYDLPVGRVFLATTEESLAGDAMNPMTSGSSQKLILAQPREAEIPAEWAFALELPDAPPPVEENARPQLPSTGVDLTVVFAGGLALMVGGLTAVALARRRSAAEQTQ